MSKTQLAENSVMQNSSVEMRAGQHDAEMTPIQERSLHKLNHEEEQLRNYLRIPCPSYNKTGQLQRVHSNAAGLSALATDKKPEAVQKKLHNLQHSSRSSAGFTSPPHQATSKASTLRSYFVIKRSNHSSILHQADHSRACDAALDGLQVAQHFVFNNRSNSAEGGPRGQP
jgi:hypothetical protein